MTELLSACFLLFFGRLAIADYVPVIIWGPNIQYKSPCALKFHNGDEFIGILNEHITSDTFIFVIAEDQLSIEDLSQCKTRNGHSCFQGIQQIKTKLYLPSVDGPLAVMEDIVGLNKIEVNVSSNGEMNKPFNPKGKKYIFFNFEDNGSDEIKFVKLSNHDQIIMKLYNELSSQHAQIVFIFTGKILRHRKRFVREATSPEVKGETKLTSDSGTFWKRERMLLYYTELNFMNASGKQPIDIKDMIVIESDTTLNVTLSSNVESHNASMNESNFIGYESRNDSTDLSPNSTDEFNFIVYGVNGYWWADNFTWNGETLLPSRPISAVDKFSFHCSPEIHLVASNKTVEIIWKGLQLQPKFGSLHGKSFQSFDDAWDCVGFVSPAILSGLVFAFMFVFVVLIGVNCMMSIKTNDRFDNPKKIITFGQSE